LSVLIDREIDGDFGWQSLKILAERGTNVKLLTNQYVKETHFSQNKPNNLSIKVIQQIHIPFNLGILVDNKEVHVEESGENIYSNDPITVSKFQGEFDRIWSSLSKT
jgi:hypothetical protein